MKHIRNLSAASTKAKAISNGIEVRMNLECDKMMMEIEIERVKRKYEQDIHKAELEIELLIQLTQYGWIYISVWSRDCDMCESSHVVKVQSLKKYYKLVDNTFEWAEGPVSINIISKDQYDEYNKPGSTLGGTRDRVMEAFENGNGSSIYV